MLVKGESFVTGPDLDVENERHAYGPVPGVQVAQQDEGLPPTLWPPPCRKSVRGVNTT